MASFITRLGDLLRRKPKNTTVLLVFEDGPPVTVGPMDQFTAEIFLIHRMAPAPYWNGRRVVSARIVH